jgi:hypothetical protein
MWINGYKENITPLHNWNRQWLAATRMELEQTANPYSPTRLYTVGWSASNIHVLKIDNNGVWTPWKNPKTLSGFEPTVVKGKLSCLQP